MLAGTAEAPRPDPAGAAEPATPDRSTGVGGAPPRPGGCRSRGSGRANTWSAALPCERRTLVSPAKDVDGPGLPPAAIATYCRPLTWKAIGDPEISPFNRVRQSNWPVAESSAKNSRSTVPPNTMPPAVASADAVMASPPGERYVHARFPVTGSNATNSPT